MKRLTAQTLRKLVPIFQLSTYRTAQDQAQYIHDLLLVVLHKRKQDSAVLSMNQFNDIVHQIEIPLRIKQLHQLYLYATYQKYESKADTKKKLIALVNQQRKKVDAKAASRWIHENIQRNQIKFGITKTRVQSQKQYKTHSNVNKTEGRLPPVKGTVSQKLQEELRFLIQIFEEMEKQRQNSGLIPINFQADDQQLQLPSTNIPYDPELYDLNKNLAKLKIKAQQRLARIIQLAKDDPKIRQKLEQSIQKFQKLRIQANERVGRNGAMKAQKRLIQARKKQNQKFKSLKLGQQEDLIRAARMYSLLSIHQKKPNKLIP